MILDLIFTPLHLPLMLCVRKQNIKFTYRYKSFRLHLIRQYHSNMQRVPEDHALVGQAVKIPVPSPTSILSYSPLVILTPERHVDLQVKVTIPVTGDKLPVVLLSHGHGYSNNLSSFNGYGPLVTFWASRGFAVIQPTHQSSKALSLSDDLPGAPFFGVSRAQDISTIIDNLDVIQKTVPTLQGRLDGSRIAVVGHSLGGNTASMLLGARLHLDSSDPEPRNGNTTLIDMHEPRIKAGILITAPGAPGPNGSDLTDVARKYSILRTISFEHLRTPALVVVGEKDEGAHLNTRGSSWYTDTYTQSVAPKSLFTVSGAGHIVGGISGYDAAEAARLEDDNVETASTVFRMTWAYLRSALYPEDDAWPKACAALEQVGTLGKVESR